MPISTKIVVAKALGSALPASSSRKNAAAWRAIQKIAVVTTIAKARSPQSPAPRSSQLRPTSRNSDTTKSPIASAQRAATLLRCVPENGSANALDEPVPPRGRLLAHAPKVHRCLTYSYIGIYGAAMARAATTADAFNAVAEPRRRQLLDVLAGGERPVNDLVALLGLAQPQVSKHLRVLREVGVVDVRNDGRQRLYRLNGYALKPIHDWVKAYEQTWSERFDQLDAVLDELKDEKGDDDGE